MAEDLDDGEFWLPPQFLTDDMLMDFKANTMKTKHREVDSGFCFPNEFPYGFGSDLSSPVESVVSSTETESDEEDYIAGLTRKMARSTLHDDLWKTDSVFSYETHKSWAMAGSPQSTLCMGGGGGCSEQGSSRGSPNGPSQVSSPPAAAAALHRNDAALDLLYAAAGEVARMRIIEEGSRYNQKTSGLLGPPRNPSPVSLPLKNPNPNLRFHSNQSLSYQQLQVAQFQQLKQQQMMKQQNSAIWGQQNQTTHQVVQNRARNGGRPLNVSQSAWPTLQQSQQSQQPNSGMRAVFLGNNNTASKRECAGTGVFLPRRIGSPTESRKKTGCSTVLMPDRVVQALNLNLEAMEAQPQLQSRYDGAFTPEYDAALKYRNNVLMAQQQKRNVRAQTGMNQELRLPSEWTY
ncbi:hypothetical protein CsSME_00017362 [Camellia sinensis var. sinensis]